VGLENERRDVETQRQAEDAWRRKLAEEEVRHPLPFQQYYLMWYMKD
jgi:hypothetical protein